MHGSPAGDPASLSTTITAHQQQNPGDAALDATHTAARALGANAGLRASMDHLTTLEGLMG